MKTVYLPKSVGIVTRPVFGIIEEDVQQNSLKRPPLEEQADGWLLFIAAGRCPNFGISILVFGILT